MNKTLQVNYTFDLVKSVNTIINVNQASYNLLENIIATKYQDLLLLSSNAQVKACNCACHDLQAYFETRQHELTLIVKEVLISDLANIFEYYDDLHSIQFEILDIEISIYRDQLQRKTKKFNELLSFIKNMKEI